MPAATPLLFTFLILIVAIALLLTDRLRADVVALLVVVALGITGVLAPREAFSGFASSAVVTIVAIFVLAEALRITGVTERAGALLQRVGGTKEWQLVVVVMIAGAALSLLMNNIAAAAVLMPAVSGVARRARVSPARLLMPLAFATILGGMATLFTTANIVVSGILRGQGLPGYGVLDFAPVGAVVVVVGIAYMVIWGRRQLPQRSEMADAGPTGQRSPDLVEVYRLVERLFRARLAEGSRLIGKPLAESGLREGFGVSLVALERGGRLIPSPATSTLLAEGDIVLLKGRLEEFQLRNTGAFEEIVPVSEWQSEKLATPEIVMVEAILAPRSALLGRTLRAVRFREKFGMMVLGIWRAGRPIRTHLGDQPLEFGDALLLQGPAERIALLRTEPDLIVLDRGEAVAASGNGRRRGWLAATIMATALLLAAFNTALVGEIMLGAALLTVLLRVFTMDQAYAAIEWRSVFLVAGMLPLGLALTRSGAAALLADQIVSVLLPLGPLALLAGLFLLTTLLTQTMAGAAVATVVAPIAIQAAQQAGLEPRSLAMGVALGTSMAFLTPLGHPVNVLVMGPGGYRFRDFLKVGWPLTLLLFGVIMLLLPVFWPLTAR